MQNSASALSTQPRKLPMGGACLASIEESGELLFEWEADYLTYIMGRWFFFGESFKVF